MCICYTSMDIMVNGVIPCVCERRGCWGGGGGEEVGWMMSHL